MNIFLHGCFNQKLHLPIPIKNSFHRMILSEPRAEKKYFLSKSTLNIYATMDNVRRKKETTFFQLQSEIPKLFKNVSFPFEHIQCPNSVFFTLAVDWCPNNRYTENHLKASTTTKEHVY